jgi:phosphoadenosine phosphosulfate reductase
MSVYETKNLFGSENKLEIAINRVKHFGKDGVIVSYSGGKDSVAVLEIVKRSGVPFRAIYNLTTIDHPELVRFIKRQPEVEIQRPKMNMWEIIEKNNAVPTRIARFCCRILKEQTLPEGIIVTGVRSAESVQRASRKMFEPCFKTTEKWYLHPILDWSENEVWEFIKTEKLSYCKLYDEGYKRLGCIGCPMDYHRAEVLDRNPEYKRGYIRALQKLVDNGKGKFKSGQEWYNWWISKTSSKETGQMDFVYLDDNSYPRAHDARVSENKAQMASNIIGVNAVGGNNGRS